MPQSLSFCIHVRFIVGLTFSARQGFIILINCPVWREHWCVSDACPFLFPSSLTLFFFLIHHYHVFLPTLPLTEGESPRLSRRMCSSCWARGHQSSGPPSLSGRPQTVQTSTEDRWPWAGAVEAAVKDSPLWRHRSSITTGHPVELSRERSPGKKQGVELLQRRDSVTLDGTTSPQPSPPCFLSLAESQHEGVKLQYRGLFPHSDIMY